MFILILGLAIFMLTHSLSAFPKWHAAFIQYTGDKYHKRYLSAGAVIGLALIVYGFGAYRASGYIPVWDPPVWTRHVSATLMLFSFILLVAAFIPSWIKTKAKHPMLAAVKIWALSHLIANGDLGSIILFGTFLAWAVVMRTSLKRRSPLLMLASVPEATEPTFGKNDALVIVIGVLSYAVFAVMLHKWLIGVSIFIR